MASHVLPQALHFISRNPTCFHVKNLGFHSNRVSGFCVPSLHAGFKLDPPIVVPPKQRFSPRAEVLSGENSGELDDAQVIETVATDVVDIVKESGDDVKLEVAAKSPRKARVKLGDIMGILNARAIEASDKIRPIPDLRTGDIVQIKLEVPQNRRRLSIYKGIVISKQNAGIHTTIRIRRIIAGIGIEIVFPVYSPNIKEIKVVSHRKVCRARLYYLRNKLPRFCTFK